VNEEEETTMTPRQKQLVKQTFREISPIAREAAEIFYGKLFALDPALRALFKGDIEEQGRKLMQVIGLAVNGLDRLPDLVPVVEDLGRRHVRYGVKVEHYETVGSALLATLAAHFGPAFTAEVREAWATWYGTLAQVMKDAAYGRAPAMAAASA
jgi:hemoglobin-like flavoprotein